MSADSAALERIKERSHRLVDKFGAHALGQAWHELNADPRIESFLAVPAAAPSGRLSTRERFAKAQREVFVRVGFETAADYDGTQSPPQGPVEKAADKFNIDEDTLSDVTDAVLEYVDKLKAGAFQPVLN